MGTVTIGSDTFDVYGTAAELATYANGSSAYHALYVAAVAADADDVSRRHVEATRLIQALDFADTANADVSTAVAAVATACYELVLASLADDGALTAASTASTIKRVEAKGVAVENFAPVVGSRFPARVMVHLADLLGSASASAYAGGVYSAGTDACSDFDDADRYTLTG